MDKVPTLEGTLAFSEDKGLWVFDGHWSMGQIGVGPAEVFHFVHASANNVDDQREGK